MQSPILHWRYSNHLEVQKETNLYTRETCRPNQPTAGCSRLYPSTGTTPAGSRQVTFHRNPWVTLGCSSRGRGERHPPLFLEVSINFAIKTVVYYFILDASILGNRQLPSCVLGWELKPMGFDTSLIGHRVVNQEVFDIQVNLLNVSFSISQIIKVLFMVNKLIY